ncbi:class I SAM-dependent methyltransferase [Nocardia wallacei]|uniref:class I SAM-dependent methyltransferase n=1 Tax=Nocardia wallacei TaxID=480035 RepID=UPI0024576C1A|nr:class I SAM-dependent methyltransferase [Nocardia wallacei]
MDPTDQAERLILAAGCRHADLVAAIEDIGAQAVGALVVDELVFRCRPPTNEYRMVIELRLRHGEKVFAHSLAVQSGQPVGVTAGPDDTAIARLEFELADLVAELYGPPRERAAGTHRTELRLAEPPVRAVYLPILDQAWPSIGRAIDAVLSGRSARCPDLGELAVRFGSDKWGTVHWFAPHYETHLRNRRTDPIRILEIGIGGYRDPDAGGESLRLWKAYFPRAIVTGVDVFAKRGVDQPRIRTVRGDQNDPAFLTTLAAEHGPFDIVIDDGSHVNEHILTSFGTLFDHVRPGGLYVIEDLWTTYCPGFGGAAGPVSPPTTAIGMLKGLLDKLHYEERPDEPGASPANLVVGVHVYHNLAVIEKGINAEGGIPPWIPHSFDAMVDDPGPEDAVDRGGR